ncbi:Wzz/FepE/Etk N-terminal domain-containing protein [Halarcobacter anaerophilus]|uniref:Polysaccharide chain length determinant N-terminal domain-containing protein n=1 Tax=Halarcobacter anaerophilus TaxID=877500 RepID=A0A4V1LQG4_9BACT|nr:Wzz/FepE/Etk N-terminal domain-containing protein [Halarcobacter anaerophilus]QDF29361.1 putative chain length determinant protein, Wzz family [Halarcobacter anaerophilus]RXJ64608.1 hypothetical protein CRV06_01225 [Halarcobacter anaerophilus]
MNENDQRTYIYEDEIDLKELILIIWDKKNFIMVFTLVVTLCSIIYTYLKNPKPIYKGELLVEIGEIQSENFGMVSLDNPYDLSVILEKQNNIEVSLPKKTNKLLVLISISTNKDEIKNSLQKAFFSIIQRHEEKVKYYKSFIMTKKISDVKIGNNPINKPKKKLIVVVAFVIGFIISIFLVFLIVFIKNLKKDYVLHRVSNKKKI